MHESFHTNSQKWSFSSFEWHPVIFCIVKHKITFILGYALYWNVLAQHLAMSTTIDGYLEQKVFLPFSVAARAIEGLKMSSHSHSIILIHWGVFKMSQKIRNTLQCRLCQYEIYTKTKKLYHKQRLCYWIFW